MDRAKGQNYMHGAAILTIGVIIMKLLGFIYKIPLGNILGDEGYSMFLSAYNIYNVFFALATAGLPVALSRLVAEADANGRARQEEKTFRVIRNARTNLQAHVSQFHRLLGHAAAFGTMEGGISAIALLPADDYRCLAALQETAQARAVLSILPKAPQTFLFRTRSMVSRDDFGRMADPPLATSVDVE